MCVCVCRYELSKGSKASASTLTFDKVPEVPYEVVVVTKDIPGNGTDGNVYVRLEGEKGEYTHTRTCTHTHT